MQESYEAEENIEFEIIFVDDDGSKDGTLEIMKKIKLGRI